MPKRVVVVWRAGPTWTSGGVRDQPGWDEHAEFIDALVAEGTFVMGGPFADNSGSMSSLELAHRLGTELRGEEAHLIALRVLRNLAERIALDDLGKLRACPHDNGDVEIELRRDLALTLPRHTRGLRRTREQNVAALEIRLHVLVAHFLERLAKLRHRDPVSGPDVDSAQENDLSRHSADGSELGEPVTGSAGGEHVALLLGKPNRLLERRPLPVRAAGQALDLGTGDRRKRQQGQIVRRLPDRDGSPNRLRRGIVVAAAREHSGPHAPLPDVRLEVLRLCVPLYLVGERERLLLAPKLERRNRAVADNRHHKPGLGGLAHELIALFQHGFGRRRLPRCKLEVRFDHRRPGRILEFPHLETQPSSGPELGPSFFDPPLQSLQGAADDRCDRLQRWMTSRLLDYLMGLPDALAGRRRAPPERPGPPVEDVRDLPWASRALRVLKPPRPSQLRLVRPAKPGEVVACEPRGPCHSLVVAEPRQVAFGFFHLGERRIHRGGSVVLDPKLELDEPRLDVGARIAREAR